MTHDADDTRRLLIEAATRGFAEHGVHTASLLEITRQAGQRNRGAVHYHFGSRAGVLVAVLSQFRDVLAARERELLAEARDDGEVASVVRALVLPAVELAERDWRGRCYLMIIAELVEEDSASLDDEVRTALQTGGGYEAYALLEKHLAAATDLPDDVRAERLALVAVFILRVVADRSRTDERTTPGRAQLATEPFAANLVAMVVGMLTAPLPE